MGLKELLDPEVLGYLLIGTGLLYYVDRCGYDIFKDQLSFSKDRFEDAQFYSKYMDKFSSEEELSDGELKILNSNKQHAIERYESLLDENVPKFLLLSRPLFYFQAKKELDYIKEESEKRLEELKVA